LYIDVVFAGFGGQGIMFIGNLMATAAMQEGRQVTYMPVYGVEMRGGTANCTVVISDKDIGSPSTSNPLAAVVMNKLSLTKFGPMVKKEGLLLVNSSLIKPEEVEVNGPEVIMVPSQEIAADAGNGSLGNMVLLGALAEKSGSVSVDSIKAALAETSSPGKEEMTRINNLALDGGAGFIRGLSGD
jgi:2-oxoglutarate ferredoxin oxidoreductase subunit gamma